MLKKVCVVIYLVVVFSIYFMFTSMVQAEETIESLINKFQTFKPYVKEHCQSVFGNEEKCMEDQFNAYLVFAKSYYPKSVMEKASVKAIRYNMDGKPVSIDFIRMNRLSNVYNLQESMTKLQQEGF